MFSRSSSTIANLRPPLELRLELAERARALRIARNLRQADLAERSGVTLASLRRFERDGEISLKNLMLIAIALNRAQDFDAVFAQNIETDLFRPEPKQRQRARK